MAIENHTLPIFRQRGKQASGRISSGTALSRPMETEGSVRTKLPKLNLYEQSNLTANQLHVWLGQSLLPELPIYNLVAALEFRGEVDLSQFREMFQAS